MTKVNRTLAAVTPLVAITAVETMTIWKDNLFHKNYCL